MLKLKKVRFPNGEHYAFLEEENGMPHFYSTLWNTVKLRPTNIQASTIENHLTHLKWFLEWEKKENRYLYSEFQKKQFLNHKDIEKIRDHMALNVSYQRGKLNFKKKVLKLSRVPFFVDTEPTVSKYTQYNRLSSVAMYLIFIAEVTTQRSNNAEIVKAIEVMEKLLKRTRPKGRKGSTTDSRTAQGISPEILAQFVATSRYNSNLNPFKNEAIRLRNDLMIRIMDETGIRVGEMLSLPINTMALSGIGPKSIFVRRNHDDVLDTRNDQPVVKTKERQLAIREETAQLIHRYIINYRKKVPNAKHHPYLFVSHHGKTKGEPVSYSTFENTIIPTLKAVDEAFSIIYPYFFRHNYNDRLSEKIDLNNSLAEKGIVGYKQISSAKEEKMRMHVMGHSDPKSATPYNQRHVKKEADKIQLKEQEEMKEILRKGLEVIKDNTA